MKSCAADACVALLLDKMESARAMSRAVLENASTAIQASSFVLVPRGVRSWLPNPIAPISSAGQASTTGTAAMPR